MSGKSLRSLALLAASAFAVGCQEGSPAEASADASVDLQLQAAIQEAGNAAAVVGETERAEALRHGAQMLRWGIRPSTIEVKIHNETFQYLGLVVGVERRRGNGEPVLIRTLVAWTGRPATALLHVASKSDHGLFGHPGNGNGNGNSDNGPDGARGQWKDLASHELWVATSGFADLVLQSTGDPCPNQPPALGLKCQLARYDVQVNGSFQLLGQGGPDGSPVEIKVNQEVRGVLLKN